MKTLEIVSVENAYQKPERLPNGAEIPSMCRFEVTFKMNGYPVSHHYGRSFLDGIRSVFKDLDGVLTTDAINSAVISHYIKHGEYGVASVLVPVEK